MEDSIFNPKYSYKVYSSLTQPILFFGIGETAFMIILMGTVILASSVSWYLLTVGVVLVIIARQICKKEPLLLDFIIENINQVDCYKG